MLSLSSERVEACQGRRAALWLLWWCLRLLLGGTLAIASSPILAVLFLDLKHTALVREWRKTALVLAQFLLKIFGTDVVLADNARQFRTRLGYLRDPLVLAWHSTLQAGYRTCTYDQPGRWMTNRELSALVRLIEHVGRNSMDALPSYGVFGPRPRAALANRIVTVAFAPDGEPCAFTAMVYLDTSGLGSERGAHGAYPFVIHLGLTMISMKHRGRRIQSPVFSKCLMLPLLNQRRCTFTVTNIGASPAGIGAVCDYFLDAFPDYLGRIPRSTFHVDIARFILSRYRDEFGCSRNAVFDDGVFVVRGSNQAEGGGAAVFIKADGLPTSRYRDERCNRFCAAMLDLRSGDEIFQVARIHLFATLFRYRRMRSTVRMDPAAVAAAAAASVDTGANRKGVPERQHGNGFWVSKVPDAAHSKVSTLRSLAISAAAESTWASASVYSVGGGSGKARSLLLQRPCVSSASLLLLSSMVALGVTVVVISAARYSWLFVPTHLGTPSMLLLRRQ